MPRLSLGHGWSRVAIANADISPLATQAIISDRTMIYEEFRLTISMQQKNMEHWVAHLATELPHLHRAVSEDEVTAETVIGLWHLMKLAPTSVINAYERVREVDIAAAAEGWQSGEPVPLITKDADPVETCRILGGLLRAAERRYLDGEIGMPSDPEDWIVSVRDEKFYLVPIPRMSGKSAPSPERDGRSFSRRGLMQMRALLTEVDGHPVRLLDHREDGVATDAQSFSGTAFEKAVFKEVADSQKFRITAIEGPTADDLRQQLRLSGESGSFAHVFPELTIDPSSRKAIQDALRGMASRSEPTPRVVVAGSFHDETDVGFVNRGFVFSRFGKALAEYRKIVCYRDPDGRHEDVRAGEDIVVLVSDVGLIAFPICKDLCHSYSTPFRRLDVDFMLVPSCGDIRTLADHQTAAGALHDEFHCRTFVAQQNYPRGNSRTLGFVLPATSQVRSLRKNDLRVQQSFSSRPVS